MKVDNNEKMNVNNDDNKFFAVRIDLNHHAINDQCQKNPQASTSLFLCCNSKTKGIVPVVVELQIPTPTLHLASISVMKATRTNVPLG